MKKQLLFLSSLAILLFPMLLCAQSLRIVPTERNLVIQIPVQPPASVQTAAKELAEHLQLATGILPKTLTVGTPIPENCFTFQLATVPAPEPLDFNHAWWRQDGSSLAITGNDTNES